MISIGKPYTFEKGDTAFLKASINISGDTVTAWMDAKKKLRKAHWRFYEDYPPKAWQDADSGLFFSAPKEYGEFLTAERSDAFVVAMLYMALMTGSDIEFQTPVSERMAFGISQLLIPAICKEEYKQIRLIGPTTNKPLATEGAVATGMSCGVDSLYTLKKYTSPEVQTNYRLTHLTYYNMGAIFHPNRANKKQYSIDEFYSITDRMSLEKLDNAAQVADMHGLPLVYVASNLDRDYYRGGYGYTGVYRNCALTLALQGLFGKYYCSSAGSQAFHITLTEGSEYYETLLSDAFSTESLQFIVSDFTFRPEKTLELADYDTAQKFLDVCFCFNNCGECAKCKRTLVTLDLLGKVDLFSSVFDIEKYKSNRIDSYVWLLEAKDAAGIDDDGLHAGLIYEFAVSQGLEIPSEAIVRYKKRKFKKKIRSIGKKGKVFLNKARNSN